MSSAGWNKVVIVGVGLIGGSLARALLTRGLAAEVWGVGRNAERLAAARAAGVITAAETRLEVAVAEADVVVACTPVDQIAADLARAAEHAPEHALLTDAGSTKGSIVHQLDQQLPPGRNFIGSHPLAGSEKSGFEYARSDLFEGRLVVLTPSTRTPAAALTAAQQLWQAVGARTEIMEADEHDRGVAWASHLPHALAALLAGCTPSDYLGLTAGGWRDTTRIAAGDPQLWTQIFCTNEAAVSTALSHFAAQLQQFSQALSEQNRAQLERLLTAGKQKRDAVAD